MSDSSGNLGRVSVLPDVAVGAEWHCVDLHLHTPGVHSFKLNAGDDIRTEQGRQGLVRRYVQALVASGIDIAVLTDYQGVRQPWFDQIRDAALAEGIVVLPGAEMSIGQGGGKGIHLLLICSPDTPPDRIGAAIAAQGTSIDPLYTDRQEHRDVDLRASLHDCLRTIREQLGCAVVAAHANEKNGVLRAVGPQQTAELIKAGLIDAVDHCESIAVNLQGTGLLSRERLESLACTLSSDPKAVEEVGAKTTADGRRRVTWIKLSKVDADALRLALHDPKTRVLRRPPEPARHARIRSMEVDGGFLDGLSLRFNDDLTALIGGRGAGKSAVLETLRYALDVAPYTDQTERLSLVRHALGSGGRVRLVLDRPGPSPQQYEVTRVLDQQPRVVDLTGGNQAIDVAPMDVFGVGTSPVILLQREIQAVARDDSFRRRLLDEIIGDEARQADVRVRRTAEELRQNARSLEDVERKLARREEHEERLNRLRAEISYFDQQGVSAKLERHSKLESDGARLTGARQHAQQAAESLRDAGGAIVEELAAAVDELRSADSEHANLLVSAADQVSRAADKVSADVGLAVVQLQTVVEELERLHADWPQRVADLLDDLRRVQEELKMTSLNPQVYLDAVRERTALEPIVQALSRQTEERSSLLTARRDVQRRLQDERRAAFQLRRQAADAVNGQLEGKLRMGVDYLGDTLDFRERLSAALKGSGVTKDALDALVGRSGTDGVELSRLVQQGQIAVADAFSISAANAQRIVRWLTDDPARLRQIEVLAPEDTVSIALVVDEVARDLSLLSGGQKATALLLLLFAQGGRPLILDQPEDDLDNRFVYEDVVALIRLEKGVSDANRRRQIITATHNANIPVNGDAELVLSLADYSGRCVVRTRASIDDSTVREEIRTVLEGGEEAFRRRAEKYGGLSEP